MEIKKGQYIRVKDGRIGEVVTFHGLWEIQIKTISGSIRTISGLEKDFKVADTPQELIQLGDIYEDDKGRKQECLFIQNSVVYSHNFGMARLCGTHISKVTKILTQNANGDYIKQWRKEVK